MTMSWSTAADWDAAQEEIGVHHESPSGTDWAAADVVEKGYPTYDPGGGGLVAYWPLDEDSGTTVYDVTNGNNGTNGGATQGQTGILGTTAYGFNGSDTSVDVSSGDALDVTTFTLMGWVYRNTENSWDAMLAKGDYFSDARNFYIGGNSSGGWVLDYHDTGTNFHRVTSTDAEAVSGSWVHLAGTYDGSSLILYVDGSSVDSTATSGTPVVSDNNASIGQAGRGGNNDVFDGRISDVRLYNRALSASEIQERYDVVAGTSSITTAAKAV